jgi:hypothetical protein
MQLPEIREHVQALQREIAEPRAPMRNTLASISTQPWRSMRGDSANSGCSKSWTNSAGS